MVFVVTETFRAVQRDDFNIDYDRNINKLKCNEMKGSIVVPTSKWRTVKNVFVMYFAFFLFLTGYFALNNLQSTMNAAKGIGPISQAVNNASCMLSCLILPELIILSFGCKKTCVISILCCLPYIASNWYIHWATMIPASVLIGLATGPLNTAQTMYLDEMAVRYSAAAGGNLENVIATFFTLISITTGNAQVWGNVISYFVLRKVNDTMPSSNLTLEYKCGIDFDPEAGVNQENVMFGPPPGNSRFILVGIFLLMGFSAAILVGFFVEPLKNDINKSGGFQAASKRFFASLRLFKNYKMLLLAPLSIFWGLEFTFYSNVFTEAYIGCSWGLEHVSFVSICYGVCEVVMAVLLGPLVACTSQMAAFILAAGINIISCALLFVWNPSPDVTAYYFLLAGAWGIADAIWACQALALCGLTFPNNREAAFSNFLFWNFMGIFLGYSYANSFSVTVKIIILLSFLLVGMIGSFVVHTKNKDMRKYVEY